MKRTSKIFCLLFAVLMLFTLSITAFAGNETNDGNIKIEVATNKGSYGVTDIAEIIATITNVSDKDINNVTAQAVFDDLAPAAKKKSQTSKSVDVLKSGESFSFKYKVTLNEDKHKINFFQKIILWFVRLFNGGYNASNNNIDVVAENVTEIKFGKFTAKNVVQVGYDKETSVTNNYTYEELIENVDVDECYEYDKRHISIDDETGIEFTNNIIMIMFDENCSDERKSEIINSIGGKVVGGNETYGELHIQIKESTFEEIEKICDQLNESNDIYAMYDTWMTTTTNTVEPNDLWALIDDKELSYVDWKDPFSDAHTWSAVAIDAPGAWYYNDLFEYIDIGVVDDGFSSSHPDLILQVISDTNTPADHGTHVAGIIGATADNEKGITGLVWKSNIFAYDAKESTNSDVGIPDSAFYEGIEKLVNQGCKVINLSLGKSKNLEKSTGKQSKKFIKTEGATASAKMAKLLDEGYDFIVVQAAGNGASDHMGVDAINNGNFCSVTEENCCNKYGNAQEVLDRIIVVANADRNVDSKSYVCYSSSNGGTQVDVAAPGKLVLSTVTSKEYPYDTKGGTSQAAPQVSGVAGLVWSVNEDFTGAEVKEIVIETAEKRGIWVKDNPESPNATGDFPLVNAKLAVEEALYRTYKTNKTGVIHGVILEETTEKPMQGVTVSFTSDDNYLTTLTNEKGNFNMNLPVGEWEITVCDTDTHYCHYGCTITITEGVLMTIASPFYMKTGTKVEGRVIEQETREALSDIALEVFDVTDLFIVQNLDGFYNYEDLKERAELVTTITTDKNGEYSLNLPVGKYVIAVNNENYKYCDITFSLEFGLDGYGPEDIQLVTKGSNNNNDDGNGDNEWEEFKGFDGGDGTKENPYQVSSPVHLNAIRNNLSAHYIQSADIDMSGWGIWEPIGTKSDSLWGDEPFTGTFNGDNYEIKNLEFNYSPTENGEKIYYGLFELTDEAEISNLNIKNSSITINCSKSLANISIIAGDIASTAYDTSFVNCSTTDSEFSVSIRSGNSSCYCGGIVGYSRGINIIDYCISDSHFNLDVNCNSWVSSYGSEIYAGGICSTGSGVLSNSINYSTINSSSQENGEVWFSGIANSFVSYEDHKSVITNCINYADFSVNSKYGLLDLSGITAGAYCCENCHNYGSFKVSKSGHLRISGIGKGKMKNCSNYGDIEVYTAFEEEKYRCCETEIGGISCKADSCDNCVNYGSINAMLRPIGTEGDDIGGLVATGGTINNCDNFGNISILLYQDKNYYSSHVDVGGIVADLNFDIKSCANEGNIVVYKHDVEDDCVSEVGGIVGTMWGSSNKNNIVENCYNSGEIVSTCNAGGIIGSSYHTDIIDCENIGNIEANAYENTSYAGGIVGIAENGKAVRCKNSGIVKSISDKTSYCGDIYAYSWPNNFYVVE